MRALLPSRHSNQEMRGKVWAIFPVHAHGEVTREPDQLWSLANINCSTSEQHRKRQRPQCGISLHKRTNEMNLLVFLLLLPILWQLPRTFWPLHLDSTATRFTGLYRRYSIDTFTGHVSNVQTSADTELLAPSRRTRRAW